jgi:hypothetical protein
MNKITILWVQNELLGKLRRVSDSTWMEDKMFSIEIKKIEFTYLRGLQPSF